METFPHAISPHTFPHLWPVSRQFLVHIALVSARDQELPGLRNGCFQLGPKNIHMIVTRLMKKLRDIMAIVTCVQGSW